MEKDGLLLLSGGGIAFSTTILSGGSVRIDSNALASDVSIADGGALNVGFSGYALSVTLASGGSLDIASGGTAVGTVLHESMQVHSGGAMLVTVVSSVELIADGASMDYTAVCSGGTFAASACALNNTFVSSGGMAIVNGGTLGGVTAVEEGGRIEIRSCVTASGLDVSSGGYLGLAIAPGTYITGSYGAYAPSRVHSSSYAGSAFVVKDGVVSGLAIESGYLDILAGGSAYNVTVSSGGSLFVSSGGKLSGRLNCSGGIISVADGAVFDFDLTKIAPWVWARIDDLSCVSGTPDYTLTVREDQAAGIYRLADGAETFDRTITVVNAAGAELGTLSVGETITIAGTKYTLDLSFGTLSLEVGDEYSAPSKVVNGTVVEGSWYYPMMVSSGFLYHDTQLTTAQQFHILSGGIANQTVVNSNGILVVSYGGVADHTTVNENGVPRIYFGGVMNYTTINKDGSLFVYEGGTANHTVVSSGTILVYSGGTANGITLSNGASLLVRAGGTVTGLEILSGGHLEFVVASKSYMNESDQMLIEGSSGGSAFQIKGAVVSGFGIESSYLHIMGGGMAFDTALNDASRMDVNNNAVAEGVTVNPGALLFVSRGSATAIVENGGYVKTRYANKVSYVPNTISGLVLSNTSASVHSCTTLNSVTCIGSGSLLEIFNGGKLTGHAVFGDEATIIFNAGCLDFDITGLEPDAPVLVDNLSRVSGEVYYTLTVNPNLKPGTYRYLLVDGVAEFDGTITVMNGDREAGVLALDSEPVTIGDAIYTLNLTGSVLAATVFVPAPPQPENLAGTSEKVSWEAVGTAQYIVEYSTDNFEHVIQVITTEQSVDMAELPSGTYQWRVKAKRGEEWMVGEAFASEPGPDTPKVVRSNEDGNDDLFFASPVGTWGEHYYAQHVGSINDWSGTNDLVSASGKGRIQNLFFGSSDPNVLCLTDGENGDAIFVDDVFTELPDEIETNMARLYRIQEIRAGAGDDIVDMTSQRFEYTGDGLTICGGDGDDIIWANKGDNFLFGDVGNDRLVGASGNDVIAGGIGNDRMDGGGGNDVFTFCDNWGTDVVEQFASGSVTLWFASGNESNWDEATLTYTDGENSVTVKGALPEKISLKFGDDNSALFASLSGMGAFADFSSQRIFEKSESSGQLASL